MIWLFLVGVSWARDTLPVRPSPPDPLSGECSESGPLRVGQPFPATIADGKIVRCAAGAEPTSSLAYLLQIEQYANGLEEVCRLNTDEQEADRRLCEAKIEELTRSKPWFESPRSARWLGRIETAIVVGALFGGYVAIDRSIW